MKFVYKPFGLIISVLGGVLAAQIFNQVWRLLPGQSGDAPDSKDPDATWQEILIAAIVQGAVFGGIKALTNRAGAKGFEKATGTWPS